MEIDRMEKEKRERELAELRDRENRLDYTDLVFFGSRLTCYISG